MTNISFNPYSTLLDMQIKQVMKENYNTIEKEVVDRCVENVNANFKPVLRNEVSKLKQETGKNDLINILSTLKEAYSKAGMEKDSAVLEEQIKRLDVKG